MLRRNRQMSEKKDPEPLIFRFVRVGNSAPYYIAQVGET